MNHYFSGTEPTPAYRAACGNHRDNAIIARRAGDLMRLGISGSRVANIEPRTG